MSKHNHKPFERHIESGEFNVNPLIDTGTNVSHQVLHPRLVQWLDSLPHPLIIGQFDNNLDDMQKQLRHSLALEIVEHGLLDEFAEQLDGIDNETLTVLLHYPITLAMLSQDYFRQNGYPYEWESPDVSHDLGHVATRISLKMRMQQWLSSILNRLTRLWRTYISG